MTLFEPPTTGDSSFEAFTGTGTSTVSKSVTFSCLYNQNSAEYDESYVGFNGIADATVYLSPKQLKAAFGTFKLDERYVQIAMDSKVYICTSITLEEELFDWCIAVEFSLKDKLRG